MTRRPDWAVTVIALVAALCLLAGCSSTSAGAGNGAMAGVPAPTQADVAYAPVSRSQVLDLWLPAGSGPPAPLLIFYHGGGFAEGDKDEVASKVKPLLAAGFAVASVNYRLSGEAQFPAAAQDAKAAVRFLRANAPAYHVDPQQVAVWGQSAGANLADLVGVTGDQQTVLDDASLGNPSTSSAVQAVVDWYGPTDFAQLTAQSREPVSQCAFPQTAQADSYATAYLGGSVPSMPQKVAQSNPITYIRTAAVLPAFAIAHGTGDCLVPVGQSQILASALRAKGQKPELAILDGADHGDPRFDAELMAPTISWLARTLSR